MSGNAWFKTWFGNRHFSDADGDKLDTRFLLLGNGVLLEHYIKGKKDGKT